MAWKSPDVCLLSAVLQYLDDPDKFLEKIWRTGAPWVVLDKVIVNRLGHDQVYVQQVPPSIYPGSYPCRSFAEDKLLQKIPVSYEMLSEFESLSFPALRRIRAEFKGYIFRKK